MLMKLTLGANFINVLWAAFTCKAQKSKSARRQSRCQSFFRFRDLCVQKLLVERWWNWHQISLGIWYSRTKTPTEPSTQSGFQSKNSEDNKWVKNKYCFNINLGFIQIDFLQLLYQNNPGHNLRSAFIKVGPRGVQMKKNKQKHYKKASSRMFFSKILGQTNKL